MASVGVQPFELDSNLKNLRIRYPDSDWLRVFVDGSSRRSRESFVRLWLTEGEPFAFRDCPAIFEELRGWIGLRLAANPKQITLLGSARIGYSMATSRYGRPFSSESDLDFAIVGEDKFHEIACEFRAFQADYNGNKIAPRSDRERGLWDANLKVGSNNLLNGFFDTNKIPYFNRYRLAQSAGQTMWLLCQRLNATAVALAPKKASVRIYENWGALIDRVSFNLRCAMKTIGRSS